MEGNYMHPRDRRSANFDSAFQGFGHDITDSGGGYEFRTIKPVAYPGRTPHIHVKVFDGTRELLTTQFYLKGHPANAKDGIFKRLSETEADSVSMEFTNTGTGPEAEVDVTV
jgi:protocatechuate 3,4-dioxygenase beta subunit